MRIGINETNVKAMLLTGVVTMMTVSFLFAQNAAPLIRRPSSVTVRKVDEDEKQNEVSTIGRDGEPLEAKPEPTPNPELTIVAVVNKHSITRAQLDRRVAARTRMNPEQFREDNEPTQFVLENFKDNIEMLQVKEMEEYQEQQLAAALREEESNIILEWQEQMLLADEARRHQLLVTNQELQAKLKELDREFQLSDQKVDNLLEAMGMTRAELESYVNDALLIEKLLQKFLRTNYSDADYFNHYEQNKLSYRIPPRKKIVHISEALLGNEKKSSIRNIKDKIEDIRDRLRSGEDPQQLIIDVNEIELGTIGTITDWSTESFVQNRSKKYYTLPDAVVLQLRELEVGETSKVIADEYIDSDGTKYILSFHVIKVLEEYPAEGETFEEALPRIKEDFLFAAREVVLRMIRDAKTHKRVTRLSGIPADKFPTEAELNGFKQPISLRIDS